MMESRIVMGLENAPEAKLIRQTVFVDEQGFKNEFDDTIKPTTAVSQITESLCQRVGSLPKTAIIISAG